MDGQDVLHGESLEMALYDVFHAREGFLVVRVGVQAKRSRFGAHVAFAAVLKLQVTFGLVPACFTSTAQVPY